MAGVIFIVASGAEWAQFLVNAVEVVAQIPVMICAEASQVNLVPFILQLGFFLLADVDLSNVGRFGSAGGLDLTLRLITGMMPLMEVARRAPVIVRASLDALSASSFPWMPPLLGTHWVAMELHMQQAFV